MVLLGQNQPWKDKKVPNWTEDDAKIVMLESPWAKSVMPDVKQQAAPMQRQGGGMGRGGVRVGGMGIPTGGRRGGGYPRGGGGGRRQAEAPSALVIRWESALPMREAELKARDTSAPTIGEDHYTLAVYGLPRGVVKPDDKGFVKELAKKAALKRDGKKDLKPASVRVLMRDDGPVVVYLFSRTTELTKNDRRIEFSGEVGTWKFATPFFTDDMVFDGKLEL
jgi:hypothetical protein